MIPKLVEFMMIKKLRVQRLESPNNPKGLNSSPKFEDQKIKLRKFEVNVLQGNNYTKLSIKP